MTNFLRQAVQQTASREGLTPWLVGFVIFPTPTLFLLNDFCNLVSGCGLKRPRGL